ncbi:unnamed protein product, partial [Adineta steineri]
IIKNLSRDMISVFLVSSTQAAILSTSTSTTSTTTTTTTSRK